MSPFLAQFSCQIWNIRVLFWFNMKMSGPRSVYRGTFPCWPVLALLGASVITIAPQSHWDQTNFCVSKHLNSSWVSLWGFAPLSCENRKAWETSEGGGEIFASDHSLSGVQPRVESWEWLASILSLPHWDSIQSFKHCKQQRNAKNDHETLLDPPFFTKP